MSDVPRPDDTPPFGMPHDPPDDAPRHDAPPSDQPPSGYRLGPPVDAGPSGPSPYSPPGVPPPGSYPPGGGGSYGQGYGQGYEQGYGGGGYGPSYPPAPYGGGYAQPGYGYASAGPKNDGLAIASMVTSIVGLVLLCACIGLIGTVAGTVMGFIARNRIAQSNGMLTGDGFALAGIIVGGVGTVLGLLYVVLAIVA